MDRSYEGDEMHLLLEKQGMQPVISPKTNRKEPWNHDKEIYNERARRNSSSAGKRFRRIATRSHKLDIFFPFCIHIVCFLSFFSVNRF